MSPEVGSFKCKIDRPTEVFPQPDSPTRPTVSPGWIEKEISSTALTFPETVLSQPVVFPWQTLKLIVSWRLFLIRSTILKGLDTAVANLNIT